MGGLSELDFAVLTKTLNQNISDYDGFDLGLVVCSVDYMSVSATQLTYLQLLTPDALTRSGDFMCNIQRGVSRIARVRVYLDTLGFCRSSPLGIRNG
jgi:hypothetical protein